MLVLMLVRMLVLMLVLMLVRMLMLRTYVMFRRHQVTYVLEKSRDWNSKALEKCLVIAKSSNYKTLMKSLTLQLKELKKKKL